MSAGSDAPSTRRRLCIGTSAASETTSQVAQRTVAPDRHLELPGETRLLVVVDQRRQRRVVGGDIDGIGVRRCACGARTRPHPTATPRPGSAGTIDGSTAHPPGRTVTDMADDPDAELAALLTVHPGRVRGGPQRAREDVAARQDARTTRPPSPRSAGRASSTGPSTPSPLTRPTWWTRWRRRRPASARRRRWCWAMARGGGPDLREAMAGVRSEAARAPGGWRRRCSGRRIDRQATWVRSRLA